MEYTIPWENTVPQSIDFAGDDTNTLIGIRYIGAQASGVVTTTSTTLTLKHGAAAAEAADTNHPVITGVSAGVITLASLSPKKFFDLVNVINQFPNWEAWIISALPDDNCDGGVILTETDKQCKTDAGYALKIDTSVALYSVAALTYNGPSVKVRPVDSGVLHRLQRIVVTHTYTGAYSNGIYECDDVLGTSLKKSSIATPSSGTRTGSPAETEALADGCLLQANGRRIVFKASAATTFANGLTHLDGFSYAFGSSFRTSKQWSRIASQ